MRRRLAAIRRSAGTRRDWRLRLAGLVLLWETLWPALWPVTALLLAFAVLAGFDLLPMLPGTIHAAVLLLLAVGLILGLVHAARVIRLPDRAAARRRLELDSGLAHRPLAALDDNLAAASADPFTTALWAAHRRRMAEASSSLRLGWPQATLAAQDPYALRAGLTLLLLISILVAGGDYGSRLVRSLSPRLDGTGAEAAAGFDVWINPPDYTGLPPIYAGSAASTRIDGPIPVPAGSTVLAQVHGGGSVPRLTLDGKAAAFDKAGESNYSITAKLGEISQLAITQGGSTLARYAIRIVPDQAPTAAWGGPPQVTPRGALRLDAKASDDYGVKSLTIVVRKGDEPPLEIPVVVPSQAKDLKTVAYEDLTASPWAGQPVELRLIAKDAIGQTGTSAPWKMRLPERVFHNPIAKAIIEQRKLLAQDPTQSDIVAETLGDLSSRPALYNNDIAVFLGLRAASDLLLLNPDEAAVASLQPLLWSLAERVEDGDLPDAQKSLRQAQQALQEALDHNASDAEIEKLTRDLQEAIQRYLQAMMQDAQKHGAQSAQGGTGPQNAITPQDIARLLDQARDLARSGARDAAKEALSKLQDMLESLRVGTADPEAVRRGQQMMRNMQDLAQKQQQLMDRAYKQAQRSRNGDESDEDQGQDDQQGGQQGGQQGQQSGQSGTKRGQGQGGQGQGGQTGKDGQAGKDGQDLAGAQDALRRQLGDVMRQLGEGGDVPQAFGRAERSMRDATEALKRGETGDAVKPQGQALDQLQQAMREMADQMQQGGGSGQQQVGHDPFGRNGTGDIDGGDIKIPTTSDVQRSREILDELRRRAGERDRPPVERDYINRLLDRF